MSCRLSFVEYKVQTLRHTPLGMHSRHKALCATCNISSIYEDCGDERKLVMFGVDRGGEPLVAFNIIT